MKSPYKLLFCGHSFCQECLYFCIENSLNDLDSFPITCPQCIMPIVWIDLKNLFTNPNDYKKTIRNALNKHISLNPNIYKSCITPNCPSIFLKISGKNVSCRECFKNICLDCQTLAHPMLTCYENKTGEGKLLIKFMKENDVRKCPHCKSLIQKLDGCFRITCRSCKSEICWKDKCMKIFPSAQECYNHLSQVHGGYY